MPSIDIPFFGNLVLSLVLVAAAYTFAASLGAMRGRPYLLAAARQGTYATCAFVALAVCLLAFAFQAHDFRLTYVARYSDRSMPWWYLVTSLWGGQDGSLLWWSFLLSGYTVAVTRWMKGRYVVYQPYVLATLMSIFAFFVVLMLFAANPFATYPASAPVDGDGLNPLLQNYWMTIHPPSLYMGFVGWSVPFAIAIAALMTGRLGSEWLKMARPWAMVAWMFLSLGLLLGCLWSYEELGWGGYWAWDPVENASFIPWLVGTAYLHSALVQERYGMLKVWNVFLMCLTFFMTIFGTFLTRSGLIASVHSFARSDIGIYFVGYLIFLAVGILGLIAWRLPQLRADHRFESMLSREFAFLLNNWILIGIMVFVVGATTYPLLTEAVLGHTETLGPPFYNAWIIPLALVLLLLSGVGPLISWRKATGRNLLLALRGPAIFAVAVLLAHVFLGPMAGFPPTYDTSAIYDTWVGDLLSGMQSIAPVVTSFTCAFVVGSIVQEFWRGARVRMKSRGEDLLTALARLVARARRRYGGYIVHLGIVLMFIGFAGAAYDEQKEAALRPGETIEVAGHTLRYEGARMEVDPNKRMVFTDLTLLDASGRELDRVSPARFIYRLSPEMPTTEVAIRSDPHDDLYVIMSSVDPGTQRAIFRVVVRPLVAFIWIGGVLGLLGALVATWPSASTIMARSPRRAPGGGAVAAAGASLLILSTMAPAAALAQDDASSSLHAGTVVIEDSVERQLFSRLLCQCGDCARLPLDTCACGWAENKRAEVRGRLAAGEDPSTIQASFRAQYGPQSISVPTDQGLDRALWAIPITGLAVAAIGIFALGRRWTRRPKEGSGAGGGEDAPNATEADYEARLDEELRRLEED